MTWTSPTLVEICIGLEINGYLPAEFLNRAVSAPSHAPSFVKELAPLLPNHADSRGSYVR
jgi:coenzyme PQQ precursor peptide PqqA